MGTEGTNAYGVDGHRGRWVVVEAIGSGPSLELRAALVDDLLPLVAAVRADPTSAMAIDMPIGLFAEGPRPCDSATRALLGRRGVTVFPAPVRATLDATDYDDACRISRQACGKALSKQAFHLIGPIRQLDELLVPTDAARVVEAHPECAFARLAAGPGDRSAPPPLTPLVSKHKPEGRQHRLDLLQAHFGSPFDALLDERPTGVPVTDLLDAAVLVITARRVIEGTEHRVGGELDPTGTPAQIVF